MMPHCLWRDPQSVWFLGLCGKVVDSSTNAKKYDLSQAMTYLMRMFDMLSKFSRIINLIFKRTYRSFCKFKITNTYYWVPLPPILSLLTIDYHLLLQLLSLPTYYWIPPSIAKLLPLPPPLLTTDYHDLLLPPPPPTTDYHHHKY